MPRRAVLAPLNRVSHNSPTTASSQYGTLWRTLQWLLFEGEGHCIKLYHISQYSGPLEGWVDTVKLPSSEYLGCHNGPCDFV